MPTKDLPDPEYVRQRLRYEPETGEIFWKAHPDMPKQWNTRWSEKAAFTYVDNHGYATGRLCGRHQKAHRIAWAIYHGFWPSGELDHINQNKTDNRIENLRDVTHQENHKNTPLRKNNTSGVSGVSFDTKSEKWQAYIMLRGTKHSLGFYLDFEGAVAARKAAERRYGFHSNHGRAKPDEVHGAHP